VHSHGLQRIIGGMTLRERRILSRVRVRLEDSGRSGA
jgi:hypothetical protein